jgi:hypothetical protein
MAKIIQKSDESVAVEFSTVEYNLLIQVLKFGRGSFSSGPLEALIASAGEFAEAVPMPGQGLVCRMLNEGP